MPNTDEPTARWWQRLAARTSKIEPHENRAALLAFLYFFCLLGSYYIVRPIRDAMGTVYGADDLEQLYTLTFLATLITAPAYGWLASRLKLSALLPWVYGFFALSLCAFFALFQGFGESRSTAAVFFVWVSVFNLFITSVFWSFMADVFAANQAKRLFGFVAAGGSLGAAVGPLATAALATAIGTDSLLLVSAAGFLIVVVLIVLLEREKLRLGLRSDDAQRTRIDHRLEGGALDGFRLIVRSPYLLSIAAFILLLTWVSTILYFQQADLVTKAFASRDARTQAFAIVDAIVNGGAILVQLFGTSRLVTRFGITFALCLVPALMACAFLAIAVSPVLVVLLGVQVLRRVAEYAVARPAREMLFTVVDQQIKYKAKNVIDTVVYRFGDLSAAWVTASLGVVGFTLGGLAAFGVLVSGVWGFIALRLGRRFDALAPRFPESSRSTTLHAATPVETLK